MGEPIRNITIVGGGTSGWISACYLARIFAARLQRGEMAITVIESPDVGIIGVGESTARPMSDLLRLIGLNEAEFIKKCNATFKLSGCFVDWDVDENGEGITWINPFFSQNDIQGVNPCYLFATYAMHKNGGPIEEDYTESISVCPKIIAALKGPKHIDAPDYQYEVPYSYHIDAVELAKILMERGKQLGVSQILDHVQEVKLDERGFVSELVLKQNGSYPIEFVIDATGFASIIIGKALGEPFEPYDKYLLNDRAAVAQLPHDDPTIIEPTTRAVALSAGWRFRVPLFNRVGSGYIYSSKFLSDDEAIKEFKKAAGPAAANAEPRVIRMRIGKTRRSWVKNCVAVGLSSGFVEPLEATAIYSVQVALQWLMTYFPDGNFSPALIDRYNALIDGLYEEIVDFIALHFCAGNRKDTPYWKAVKHDMEIPPRLKANLELWRSKMPDELDFDTMTFFSPTSYCTALMGKEFYKGREYLQAAPVPEVVWRDYLARRRARTQKFLAELPDHYTLLRAIRGEERSLSARLGDGFLSGQGI